MKTKVFISRRKFNLKEETYLKSSAKTAVFVFTTGYKNKYNCIFRND